MSWHCLIDRLDFFGLAMNPKHEQIMQGKPEHCKKCVFYRSTSVKISLHDFWKHTCCAAPFCSCYMCSVEKPFCRDSEGNLRYCGGVGGHFQ
jgi:hypothetical protein